MSKLLRRFFPLLLLSFSLPATCWGWGKEGHEIVGRIAENRLSVNARREIRELIGDASIADENICTWADQIRRVRDQTAPWHYVDIPVTKDNQPTAFDPDRDCKNHDCVVDQLEHFVKVLADKDAAKADRIEALKFAVHFAGDIHQPLHCADRPYGASPGDRGGNSVLVRIEGDNDQRPWNLHSVWDIYLIGQLMGQTGALEYADSLSKNISDAQSADWGKGGNIAEWANESNRIAAAVVYKGIPTDPPADGKPVLLDATYIDAAKPVVEEQLEKAGVRLAKLLNESFP